MLLTPATCTPCSAHLILAIFASWVWFSRKIPPLVIDSLEKLLGTELRTIYVKSPLNIP